MKRVLVLNKEGCEYLLFETIHFYQEIVLEEKEESICINGDYTIFENQSIQINENTIYLLESNWIWSIKNVESHITIGRDESNTIVLSHPSISNFHAIIEKDGIQDCESTNGTFVNAKRIGNASLHVGDCIWIVDTCILYFESFLVINKPLWKDIPSTYTGIQIPCKEANKMELPHIEKEYMELEAFMTDNKVEKQALFQSIGSSILILFSSCISLFVMYCMQPKQISSLISMVLMSLSMSISFLIFGLYSRNYNFNKQNQEIERKHTLYKQYLQSIEDGMNSKKEQLKRRKDILSRQCIDLEESFRMYPTFLIAFEKKELFQIQYKNPGYQNIDHPLHAYVKKWLSIQDVIMDVPLFYEKEKKVKIHYQKGIVDAIFLRYAYSRMDCKVVIVSEQEYVCISHPLCTKSKHKLWIHDTKSFQEVYPLCDESMLYIIEEPSFYPDMKSKCKYCIWIDQNEGIDICAYMNQKKYRQALLYYAHQEEMDSLPYFQKQQDGHLHLNVCLGIDEKKEPIEIDFSQQGHGPHGLVAGSTGSGKSELLASLMMQLVLKNDADRVQFILIDFKGGALGNIFQQFPHFKGLVTNLDKKDVKRFLVCMDRILEQRQEKLSMFQKEYPALPNDIDVYNQYKKPISHLFLIVDELAQLKSHFPEVITKLKEIARIGRSLGIHLILSTQKPVGVVDDQIWANSTYQICLKVANVQDSKEILHSDKAAYLEHTGQFIFQSGPSFQRKGHGLYLHQKIENPYTEVDSYDIPLYENTSMTILDSILQNQKPFTRQWLIPPGLQEYSFHDELMIYDDIYNLCQKEWILHYGKSISILTHEIQILSKSLIAYYQHDFICTYKVNQKEYVDYSFFNPNELYWIHALQHPCTLIAYIENVEDLTLLASLINHSRLRIVLLLDHMETIYLKLLSEVSLRAHYHWMDRGWVYLYYANAINVREAIQLESALCIDNRILEMRINEDRKCIPIKNSRFVLEKDSRIALGFTKEHQAMYLDEMRSVLICYVQKSVEEKIVNLLNECRDKKISTHIEEDFDICILNPMEDTNALMSKGYLSKQFDIDVLWVGQGFMEYGYPLKRKCFETGVYDMLYFHKQTCYLLNWS